MNKKWSFLLAAVLFIFATAPALAEFPARDITIVVGGTAGSPVDIMARELARSVHEVSGVNATVHNATGGAGGVGIGTVMSAPADGYTWGVLTAANLITLRGPFATDFPIANFTWVARVQDDTFGISVLADAPWETLDDLVAYARANPGQLVMGGNGTGTGFHLGALQTGKEMGFDFRWVPFEAGPEVLTALLGRHVQVVNATLTASRPFVEAGQIRMLVATGDRRPFPDTPTYEELGIDNTFSMWRAIYLRTGVDPALVQPISDLIREATLTDSFVEYMKTAQFDDVFMGHVELTESVLNEFESLGAIIEELLN